MNKLLIDKTMQTCPNQPTGLEGRWKPKQGPLLTPWGEQVNAHNILPEYPRPQIVRERWLNLNGVWELAIQPKADPEPTAYKQVILVPFGVESALSGVMQPVTAKDRLWYRRSFSLPPAWGTGERFLLHFGAVDWETRVWVNGQLAGEHTGGYDPFSFEITPLLVSSQQKQTLVVSVWDPTDDGWQERGKQTLYPHQIFYTPISGIWQTVWLEPVPQSAIKSLRITPDLDAGMVKVRPGIHSPQQGQSVRFSVGFGGKQVAGGEVPAGASLEMAIPEASTWHPDHPHLYDLEVSLWDGDKQLDQVTGYFGMRKFGMAQDGEGIKRLTLNNEVLFQYGPLDQGYWPDGLYTAPSDKALVSDIEYTKKIGMNMIRKHIKVEPARWYTACDRLGMIVWQDMPNGGGRKHFALLAGLIGFYLKRTVPDDMVPGWLGRGKEESRENYRKELKAMLETLYSVPCIGVWVPFNESWGQFHATEIGDWVKEQDPTRLVDAASGWLDQGSGDIHSIHVYVGPDMPKKEKDRALVLSEFGGVGLKVAGHVWDQEQAFAYELAKTHKALADRYEGMMEKLAELAKEGLSAAIYTETSDVEKEINGFLTYDRRVEKLKAEWLAKLHRMVIEAGSEGE